MKHGIHSLLFFTTFVFVLLGAGCAGKTESDAPSGPPAGTINFIEKNPQTGVLRGTYEYQGYTIKFDIVRGGENPVDEVVGGGAPTHAIDSRLCDAEGFCFSEAAGGHALADPDWIAQNQAAVPDAERAKKNWTASWNLHSDLQRLDPKTFPGLEEELQALENVSYTPPNHPAEPSTSTQSNAEGTPQKGVLSINVAAANTYRHYFRIMKKIVFNLPYSEHSSTWTIVLDSSNNQISQYATSNHGTYAYDPSMSLKCYRSFTNRPATVPFRSYCPEPATQGVMHPPGTINCCSSAYGFLNANHVCNDDSALQRDMIVMDGVITPEPAYCRDNSIQMTAPNCQ